MMRWVTFTVLLGASALSLGAPPTQTVYRCSVNGKTVYTDTPCLNAKQIDATPTRGMDTSTGVVRKGDDALRDDRREGLANALKPLTGMNREQFDQAGRRTRLDSATQAECKRLDALLPITTNPQELFSLRSRFKALGCE